MSVFGRKGKRLATRVTTGGTSPESRLIPGESALLVCVAKPERMASTPPEGSYLDHRLGDHSKRCGPRRWAELRLVHTERGIITQPGYQDFFLPPGIFHH